MTSARDDSNDGLYEVSRMCLDHSAEKRCDAPLSLPATGCRPTAVCQLFLLEMGGPGSVWGGDVNVDGVYTNHIHGVVLKNFIASLSVLLLCFLVVGEGIVSL